MRALVCIGPTALEALGSRASTNAAAGFASATFPAANRAIGYPFTLSEPWVITTLWVCSGATVGTNNVDVGIYDVAGTRLISSGAELTANANALQLFDITDTLLGVGKFFMAVSLNGTTDTLFRALVGATEKQALGMWQMASAHVLPATVTFANPGDTYVPLIGCAGRTTI